ncbi:MAG: TonB-dependent receptor [Maricaulaceae bacterium]|jgi:outer membrane receptor protein involved in Fe transport
MKRINRTRSGLLVSTLLAGAAALALPAVGYAAEDDAASDEDRIVVTGTRIRNNETATAAPIGVIDVEVLAERGFVQIGEALNDFTSITPDRPISPFNGTSSGLGDQYPALFGLGAGRTLTLVNGRRTVATTSAFGGGANDAVVDTNTIPVGLLQRVEVVQGGGAAIYGSDAMGGVVNYILRDDFDGLEVDAQYGISDRGDYETPALRATWGTNFDGGNIAANLEWSRTESLLPDDRPESARGRVTSANPLDTGPNDGISSVAPVFDAAFWEFNTNGVPFAPPDPTGSSCGGFPLRCFITTDGVQFHQFAMVGTPAQFSEDGTTLIPYDPGTFPSPGPSIPFASGGEGYPFKDLSALYSAVERTNFNLIGDYDLSPTMRLSGELLVGHVEGEDPRASIPSNTILNSAATGSGPILITGDNAYLTDEIRAPIVSYLDTNFGPGAGTFGWTLTPFFAATLPVYMSKIFPDLLPSTAGTRDLDTYRALVALEGDLDQFARDYYWSVSLSYGRAEGSTRNWGVWADRFDNAIVAIESGGSIVCGINADPNPMNDDPDCAPINPFGVGNISQAATDYVSAEFGQDFDNTQIDFLATFGGELFTLPAGDVGFSLAYERREEEANFNPTAATLAGVGRAGVPTAAQSADYETNEFSGELLVPVFGGDHTLPLVESLELSGAYRYVDNSIAGSEDVWNIGARWGVNESLLFRASVSRNFRAPNLAQLFTPMTTGLGAIGTDPCDADRINGGPNPAVRLANCQALFAANPGYGDLATFQDPAENFQTVAITSGGNPDLRNEISDTLTYGVVFQPTFAPGLTMIADRVEVELTDGLSAFTPASFLATCFDSTPQPADICAVTTRNAMGHVIASSSTTFNAGRINFEGETYKVSYAFPDGAPFLDGDLEVNLEATHVSRLETSVTGVDLSRTDGTAAQPDWRARFNARYGSGPVRIAYTLNYLPETQVTREATIENNPNPRLDANYRHSLSGQLDLNDMVTLRAGVENLTDEGPSFPSTSYGDILGRRYFVGIRSKF